MEVVLQHRCKGLKMATSSSFKRSLALKLFFLIIVIVGAGAFSFSPMTVSIASSGAGAVMTYKVTNDSDQQTAVSIKVTTRTIDEAGKETNAPADKEFLVFPARVVLKPRSSQNVKVQYRGNPAVTSEVSYRVFAEQLPVDFSKSTTSGVSILLTYVAALYVSPKNAAAKLVIDKAVGSQKDGKQGIDVTVKNEGTRHALIANPVIKINQAGGLSALEFTGESASAIDGQNILAKSARTFFVPWEAAVNGTAYEGTFNAELD
jgi:fimbrial chaperone protein